ncbi:hypothetical protein RHS04_00776 [Rhizoctonia solani]|uniref:Uncharacterized protein n=1 Tax=Rhizoctonia solani TaxID=456999 RepID=A0A8H7HHJ2_9AGAM|nr:hypothetical protein RHS04_00776 [Rhizoctonia solani]
MHFATNVSRVLAQSLGTRSSMLQGWIGWIHEFERSVTTGFRNNMSPNDIGDCLKAHLELLALKASLMNGIFGYLVLRDALPKFLSLVATDSNLLIEQHNGGMVISFHRIINTHRYELTKFAVHDVLTVLLLGVPLLVEYGYDGDHEPENPMFEWIHGIPATFLEVMAQINSRRTGSRVRLDDWQTLEERVLFWKSRYAMLNDAPVPGSDDAERVAVQEGWRHLLLIYIYMGVCGASSDDPRVQGSVSRIFQLASSVRSSQIGMHMLPQCVVQAGIAARMEKHRVAVYQKLMSFTGPRLWLFDGPQYSQFLYHLWRGVGEGGRAVTWDDYVRSRQAIIST